MDSNHKKRILLLITNSYAATNVIHSGLIKPLAELYDVYIISNLINQKEINEISRYFDIKPYRIDISIPEESHLVRILRQLEKAVFFHFFNIETQKIKEQQKGFWYHFSIVPILKLFGLLKLNELILKTLRKSIICLISNENTLNKLIDYNFCGVISSSPLDIRENSIVNFMKRKNIPSLAMIISWDNLTSKGIINADHDYVLVWNVLMANEYNHFYSIFNSPNTQVCITGIPRFDLYFRKLPEKYSASEFMKKYQVNAADKVILFTTSALTHFPNQTDIIQHLLEYTSQNQDIKIIVRCHAGDHFELYRKFFHEPNLRIWHPDHNQNPGNISQWMPDLEILYSLAEMLRYCDVCLNVASTIRLEAAICNIPGISIAYDGNSEPALKDSVRRFYAYSHQIPLNDLEIDQMVFSKNELFDSLDQILYNSSSSAIDYTKKIKKFTFHSGPFGVSTSMKYIDQWLN